MSCILIGKITKASPKVRVIEALERDKYKISDTLVGK